MAKTLHVFAVNYGRYSNPKWQKSFEVPHSLLGGMAACLRRNKKQQAEDIMLKVEGRGKSSIDELWLLMDFLECWEKQGLDQKFRQVGTKGFSFVGEHTTYGVALDAHTAEAKHADAKTRERKTALTID